MKTIRLFMLAAVAMLFANCTHEELDAPLKTGVAVALMETEDTKSNANDEGYFTWATGDKIWINTSNGNLTGTLSEGAGTPNGTFTYSYVDGQTPTGYAMYPYSASHNIADDIITFNMPAAYELGTTITNTNAAMLAVPAPARTTEETATFNFSHLGGVFRFVIKNAPVGADKFTLSLGDKKINGDFTVATNDDGAHQITTADAAEGDNLTTLSFTALSTAQDITLFVPVPVGEYTGIEAKLYDGEKELGSWGSETATNNVTRRALVLMSPITFSTTGGNIENEQQVATQTQLTEAIAKGGSITVTEDITLTEAITIPSAKEVTLDLNGNNITASQVITVGEGATLSIVNSGQAVAVKSGEATSSASITSDDDIIKASKNSTITIGEGVSLHSVKNCAVFVPAAASGVTINTAGNLSAAANYAPLYVNGNVTSGTINITGGSITHNSDVAVYIAGNADVTVSGDARITGTTAMEVRAGKLIVNGGTFTATASPSEYQANGNGTTSKGVALAMCKHNTTEFTLTAVVNGGTFTGAKSVLVNKDLGDVSFTVNGGTFSDFEAIPYLAEGKTLTLANDVTLSELVTIPTTFNGVLDLNGKTVSYTTETSNQAMITNKGNLTVKDSQTGGKLLLKYTGEADANHSTGNYTINNSGTLKIEGGRVEADVEGEAYTTHALYSINNSGKVHITGGEVINEHNFAIRMWVSSEDNSCDVTVDGGHIKGTRAVWIQLPSSNTALAPKANLTVNGGKLECLPLTQGNYTYNLAVYSYSYGAQMKNVNINVTGGEIDGDIALNGGRSGAKVDSESLSITGGTLTDVYSYGSNVAENITIKGGTFSSIYPAEYVTSEGEVLTLNSDVTLSEMLSLPAGVSIDGNNHKVAVNCEATAGVGKGVFELNGGTLKNITFASENTQYDVIVKAASTIEGCDFSTATAEAMGRGKRAIFTGSEVVTGNLAVTNCTFDDKVYAFNFSNAANTMDITFTNCSMKGWLSGHGKSHKFVNCEFGKSGDYQNYIPYCASEFTGCTFTEGFKISLKHASTLTFDTTCKVGETALTSPDQLTWDNSGDGTDNGTSETVTIGTSTWTNSVVLSDDAEPSWTKNQ